MTTEGMIVNRERVYWPGAGGNVYQFEVFGIDELVDPWVYGVYILAVKCDDYWEAVDFDEGHLFQSIKASISQSSTLENIPTHILVQYAADQSSRELIKKDLLPRSFEFGSRGNETGSDTV